MTPEFRVSNVVPPEDYDRRNWSQLIKNNVSLSIISLLDLKGGNTAKRLLRQIRTGFTASKEATSDILYCSGPHGIVAAGAS